MDHETMKEFLGVLKNKINDTKLIIDKICNDAIKENEKIDKNREKKIQYDLGFVSLESWFIRCSDHVKYKFFCILFPATPIDVLIEVYQIFYSCSMKDSIYAAYSQEPNIFHRKNNVSYINPYLDADTLNRVIMYALFSYRHLDRFYQQSLLIGLLQLCDVSLKIEVVKYLTNLLTIYEDSKPKKIEEKPTKSGKKGKKGKKEKKKKKEKKGKKGKKGKKEVVEPQPEPEPPRDIEKEYQEWLQKKFKTSPSLEKLNIEVEQEHKKWDDAILKYRLELGEDIGDEGGKKKKKKPKKKKGKKGGQNLDEIQMLPIWVNKKMVADPQIDPKSKKKLGVNKYLKFLCKSVGQDLKCRNKLDKTLEKMGLDNTSEESDEEFNYVLRLKFSKKHLDDISIQKKSVERIHHTRSILGEVLEDKNLFNLPIVLKESFPREI